MEKLYLIMTHSGSMPSRVIRRYTKKDYSHVSISFDKHIDRMYSFGRLYKYTPLPAGFIEEQPGKGFYSRCDKVDCLIYEIDITSDQRKALELNLKLFKENHKKYRYNIIGLATLAFGIPLERDHSFFCSQFVAHILMASGINILDKRPGLVQPTDFISNKTNLIYKGDMLKLPEIVLN